jgi:alpha-glucosidase
MRILSTVFLILCGIFPLFAEANTAIEYSLLSPGKDIEVKVHIDSSSKSIHYSAFHKGKPWLDSSPISMTIRLNGKDRILGKNPAAANVKKRTVNNTLTPVIRQKSKEITERYNELAIAFKGNYSLIFRAYDDGIAYRFKTGFKKEIEIISEEVVFNFSGNDTVYFPEEESFFSHNERLYLVESLANISPERMCSLPALVQTKEKLNVLITESDLTDYPGLWLRGEGKSSLVGIFPPYPLEEKQEKDRHVKVTRHAEFIAKTKGTRSFPWRVLTVAETDGQLITNQLTYLLSSPEQLKDVSWIRPGKVAWDWFNYNNIYGVDFEAGINTETYKYYIDFASRYGIEYVILDEGWYKLGDLLDVVPGMDIPELVEYGKKKNVGIILWVIWKTLDDQLVPALDQFEKWGVKGIKVDFMQRDDQWMVNYYYKIAREAAKRHLLVDFHGSYKPAGLHRAYPNVLTREGVKGLENNKWMDKITPGHNVTLPFIRMAAGPMDYTPGAMVNAQPENFRAIFKRPMSMGTRCHQLAMYVVYESPLQMLADSPSNYLREPECMEFLSKVPTVWDETVVLEAKVGDYIVLARKSNEEWYIGAMTDEIAREFSIDLSFLSPDVKYTAHIYRDGANAHRFGSDYKKVTQSVAKGNKLTITLATGGGWATHISPVDN